MLAALAVLIATAGTLCTLCGTHRAAARRPDRTGRGTTGTPTARNTLRVTIVVCFAGFAQAAVEHTMSLSLATCMPPTLPAHLP